MHRSQLEAYNRIEEQGGTLNTLAAEVQASALALGGLREKMEKEFAFYKKLQKLGILRVHDEPGDRSKWQHLLTGQNDARDGAVKDGKRAPRMSASEKKYAEAHSNWDG